MLRTRNSVSYTWMVLIAAVVPACLAGDEQRPAVSFYRDIRPVFQAKCQGCHQPARSESEFVITSYERLMAGGASGTVIEPGAPGESYLIEQITPVDGEPLMPPAGEGVPVTADELKLIRDWIVAGAIDDTPPQAKSRYDQQHLPEYHVLPLVTSLDFSPDGQLLAVAGNYETLLHRADGSEIVARLVGLSARIERVRFSPDGAHLAVLGGLPGRSGELQVWHVAERELEQSVSTGYDTAYGASWSPDGRLIAFGTPDNMLRAVDLQGKERLLMRGHTDWVLDTVFSLKGDHLVSVGRDMTAKLTRVDTEQFLDNITSITPGALKGGISAVARHPRRDEVLVGGADGVPQIYRMYRETDRKIGDNANLVRRLPAVTGRIWSVAFSPDGKRAAVASSLDGAGCINVYATDYDSELSDELRKILGKPAYERSAEEKEAAEKYLTGDVTLLHTLEFAESPQYAVAFHPREPWLAAAGTDGHIRLIDTQSGSIWKTFPAAPLTAAGTSSVATATDGRQAINRVVAIAAAVGDALVEPSAIQRLEIAPVEARLTGPCSHLQMLVRGVALPGEDFDLTRHVTWEIDPAIVSVDDHGWVSSVADGTATIRARFGSWSAAAQITVVGSQGECQPDFVRDVAPIISRLGCNAGTCHGAKDGKNGFKLSLRGYDPVFDLRSLAGDHKSRRLQIASPDDSLMLLKATGAVPHEGGRVTDLGSEYYQILRAWIAGGARLNRDSRRPERVDLEPQNPILGPIGAQQQFCVIAHYEDGTTRDVTREAFIESGNSEVAEHDQFGLLTAVRRGEAPVLVRYEGCYAATTLTVMGDREGFVWQSPPSWGEIDDLVAAKWRRMKILPSDLCSDYEFLRRVTLDLTGLPPGPERVQDFLADQRPIQDKRNAMIDQLVGSPEFVDYWTNKWSDLLQINSKFLGEPGARTFRDWVREQVERNTPYDQFAYQILTATGSNYDQPAAAYYKILRTPDAILENTTHLFLATRFNCNKCHDHPFERWTQDDYYRTGAYFAQISLQPDSEHSGDQRIEGTAVEGAKPLYEIVSDATEGEMIHERTGEVAAPRFPYAADYECSPGAPRREQVAKWLTSQDNRYFASSYVNRLWGYLLGVGIIEPIDDIRAGNPPTNPELLEYLTHEFVASGFDVRHVIRLICQSRTYQLSVATNRWNGGDDHNYSHARARRLPAEVLLDAVYEVTGTTPAIPGTEPGTRAVQLADSQRDVESGFLANLGRPPRESACECERVNDVHLGAVMSLLNGPEIARAIGDPQSRVAQLVEELDDDRALIEALFIRVLNRPVAESEIDLVLHSWSQVERDHQQLVQQLAEAESEWTVRKDQLERDRLKGILRVERELADYQPIHEEKQRNAEAEQQTRIQQASQQWDAWRNELPGRLDSWEQTLPIHSLWTRWEPRTPQRAEATGSIQLAVQPDGSLLATGALHYTQYDLEIDLPELRLSGIAIEALPHDDLPGFGPGLNPNGNFVVSEIEVSWRPEGQEQSESLRLVDARSDFIQEMFDVKNAINGKRERDDRGWAVGGAERRPHLARFQTAERVAKDQPGTFIVRIICEYGNGDYPLAHFRLFTTDSARPLDQGLDRTIAEIILTPSEQRTEEQRERLADYYGNHQGEYLDLRHAWVREQRPLPPDQQLIALQQALDKAQQPVAEDPRMVRLRQDVGMSVQQLSHRRLTAAQDLVWALINSPEFLFNH